MELCEPVSPPITWFGSKSRLVKQITKHFPAHHTYVDVFGGSGAVLLGKKPSKVEVYNDLNKKLSSLFRVLSDKDKTQELIHRLEMTPYSRDAFQESSALLNHAQNEQDEIELARLMIVVQRQSHGGLGKQWSYCIDASSGGYSASVRKFHAGIERLPEIQDRMRKVQIENLCYSDLLPRYDRPKTLFYLDPPYIPDTRTDNKLYYEKEMSLDDHKKLVVQLLTLKGMCVLSGYQADVYKPLTQHGWKLIEIETVAYSSTSRATRTECLWLSPSCQQHPISSYPDIADNDQLSNRQKAAFRVHRHRKENSEKAIKEAIYSLKRTKKKVTKIAVSRLTGISREHISRYYSHLF